MLRVGHQLGSRFLHECTLYIQYTPLLTGARYVRISNSPSLGQLPAGNDAVTTVASAANGTAGRPSFDATVLGLGELRTAAHTNAKQPLYNFLARCRSPGRRVGDAEYWRRAVWAWCAEENLRPVDLSTKQVSLYLRQMAQVRSRPTRASKLV